MEHEVFEKFQTATTKGQIGPFLSIARTLPLATLEDPVLRNVWLFYSELLFRAFGSDDAGVMQIKAFAKHHNEIGEIFHTLPITSQPFFSVRALVGFYKGCQQAEIPTDELFSKILDHVLTTPSEQMRSLQIHHLKDLLTVVGHSNDSKFIQVGQHYCSALDEEQLLNSSSGAVFSVLPYISFDIHEEKWAEHHSNLRQAVHEKAISQQRARIVEHLPENTSNTVRKM